MKYSSVNAFYLHLIFAKLCKDRAKRKWRGRNFNKKKMK